MRGQGHGWRRRAAAAGLAGSAAVTVLAAIVHTLAPAQPFLPLTIAQALIRAAPGGFATWAIERLGHWAMRLAVAGTVAAFLLSGAALGLLIPRMAGAVRGGVRTAGALSFLPLWLGAVLLYPEPDPQSVGRLAYALASLPLYVAGGVVGGHEWNRLGRAPAARATDLSRRMVLRSLWWGTAGALVGVAGLGRILYRRPDPGRQPLALRSLAPATPPSPSAEDAAFSSISGLTPEITSNDEFYVVDEEIIDPDVDPATWVLQVGGLVDRPFALGYAALTSLPAVERYQTLECISNEVGGDLMSTAKWAGVPLPLILDRAAPGRGAVEVVFRAAGGYSDSLPIDQAMDESTLIAVGMNGRVLPRAHGFPARLLSVGTYGMKNPKWLMGIEVVDRPHVGYWERRGWAKGAAVKTGSRIDVPVWGADLAGAVTIAGVAFSGDRGVSGVEVSTDGGRTWDRAQLRRALSPYTWREWRYRWLPQGAGQSGILVRAYDGEGVVQTARVAPPHPDGASGYHAITVKHGTA